MLLSSEQFLLSLAPHTLNARGRVTKMLYQGALKFGGLMLLRSKLFYCLRLPIHPMLKGGDQNAMLGVMKVLRIMLLRSKLFLLSPAPHPSNAKGR